MPYDKKSFIAGVAVGRQLKGWSTGGSGGDPGPGPGPGQDIKFLSGMASATSSATSLNLSFYANAGTFALLTAMYRNTTLPVPITDWTIVADTRASYKDIINQHCTSYAMTIPVTGTHSVNISVNTASRILLQLSLFSGAQSAVILQDTQTSTGPTLEFIRQPGAVQVICAHQAYQYSTEASPWTSNADELLYYKNASGENNSPRCCNAIVLGPTSISGNISLTPYDTDDDWWAYSLVLLTN